MEVEANLQINGPNAGITTYATATCAVRMDRAGHAEIVNYGDRDEMEAVIEAIVADRAREYRQ